MLTFIEHYWDALVTMTAEMAPYLLLGFFIAGLLRTFVPQGLYSRHLAPRTMGSVVKAALLGIPLPLCSCGVIPTSVGLRREGASHGACTSFLIATPQTGVDSIAATYSLMGLPFAIVRPIAALFTAMFGGFMVNKFAREDEQISAQAAQSHEHDHCECGCGHDECGCEHDECGCEHDEHHHDHGTCDSEHHHTHASFWHKLKGALSYGFVEMMQDVGKWLVIGLLIAALITVAVPNEWLAALHEYKLLNMIIVLAIAIPMYVCATGSIPIAVSLMAKGLTPGAALVLLMAGPAVNSASILVIGKVFGRRTLSLYVLSIVIGAMLFGLGIDYLLPQDWFAVSSVLTGGTDCTHCLSVWDWVFIAVFILLLVNAFTRRHQHHHGHEHQAPLSPSEGDTDVLSLNTTEAPSGAVVGATLYKITGMTCNHCRANVEKAIRATTGVTDVTVDLPSGMAYVSGTHDAEAILAAVSAIGFEAEKR